MPSGSLIPVPVYLVTVPEAAIRPIELFATLVNHNAPSEGAAISQGKSIPFPE